MDSDKPPPEDLDSTQTFEQDSGPPQRIGNYRILQKLGEGGMGVVYLAEQEKPIRRRVAFKIIKLGMDTKAVIARFEAERQALAMMDHPAVAKVFDAGTTEQGRPFFVMEYVKGVPITEYCDRHKLSNRERLALFTEVCEGVQHAHQKAIIHRDLKPSNVLVGAQDGIAAAKIIDFGVAKATAQKLTEKTMFTELGVLIGTPEYMSPEQADLTGEDVDTRTDVYSLGVMLYEMLVGALPFDSKELRSGGYEGLVRRIREDEPPKPSVKLSTLGDRSTESAQHRRVDVSTLRRQLRGDLDWITMKALEKDRTRRYGSPSDLATDIERHLNDQPVLAGPPSAAYRMEKFVRRHKVGVTAGVVVALAMILGIAGTTVGLVRTQRAEAQARQEAETAEEVTDFLVGLFEVFDPGETRGNTITAREILDKGVERIGREMEDQPLIQARLMGTIGLVYHSLGLYEEALPLLEQSLAVRREHLGERHPDVAESLFKLGVHFVGINDFERAKPLLEPALQIQEDTLGSDHPDVAWTLRYLGSLQRRSNVEEARTRLERAVAIWENSVGPDHPDFAHGLHYLALFHSVQGNLEEAKQLFERALAIQEKAFGPYHPRVGDTLTRLGGIAEAQGDNEGARILFERASEVLEKVLGPNHVVVSYPLLNLGTLLVRTGDYEAARPLLERGAAILEAALGPRGAVPGLERLVGLHKATGENEEAVRILEQIVTIQEEHRGPDSEPVLISLWNLATAYIVLKDDRAKADLLFERALEIAEKRNSPDLPPPPYWQACYHALVGERDTAMRSLRRAVETGFTDHAWIVTDPDLDSLHGDPEFEAIVAEIKKPIEEE